MSRGSCSRVSGLALVAGALLLARSGHAAAEPPLVVVVSSNSGAPFVRRLAAELSLFGYRVEIAERKEGDEPGLTSVLTARGGAALISVDQRRETAEVIVAARPGGSEEHRDVERLDPRRRADTNAAVLAERFRARLTELGIAPRADPPPPAPPVALRPLPASPRASREPRVWVGAGVGVSAGGLGPLPEANLELRAFPLRWLSTSAFGKVSLRSGHVEAREGSADVRLLTGGLTLDAYPVVGKISAHVGVAAVLVDAEMSGRAAPPWVGRDDSVLVPGALLQGGAALRLTPRVSAEVRGFVGACTPRIAVRIAEHKAADFGQPFVGATLGVFVGLF